MKWCPKCGHGSDGACPDCQPTPAHYLNTCPGCGGPADNGFDRCVPPSPYYCTKCMDRGVPFVNTNSAKILYGGKRVVVSCDRRCDIAWGINWRGEKVPPAPADPGTYEGGHAKPASPDHFPNKWCVRECERSTIAHDVEPTPAPCTSGGVTCPACGTEMDPIHDPSGDYLHCGSCGAVQVPPDSILRSPAGLPGILDALRNLAEREGLTVGAVLDLLREMDR